MTRLLFAKSFAFGCLLCLFANSVSQAGMIANFTFQGESLENQAASGGSGGVGGLSPLERFDQNLGQSSVKNTGNLSTVNRGGDDYAASSDRFSPDSALESYFGFSFDVLDPLTTVTGFSFDAAVDSGVELAAEILRFEETGQTFSDGFYGIDLISIDDLLPPITNPSTDWTTYPSGVLAGDDSLDIELPEGRYEVRIYGMDANGGSGQIQVDNIQLTTEVEQPGNAQAAPEPSSLMIFASTFVGGLMLRRRRS